MNKNFIFFILIFSFAINCKKSECIKSVGNIIQKKIILDYKISEFELFDNINIEFDNNLDSNVIILKSGENLINFISINQQKGKLVIKDKNKCDFLRSYKDKTIVYLPYSISKFTHRGNGYISNHIPITNNIDIDIWNSLGDINLLLNNNNTLIKNHTGSSNIHLKGKSDYAYIYSSSYGLINCEELICNKVDINYRSISDLRTFCNNTLNLFVKNKCKLIVFGKPSTINIDYMNDKAELIIK